MKLSLKKTLLALLIVPALSIGFTACEDDDDDVQPDNSNSGVAKYQATINMTQFVRGTALQMNTANKPYTNKIGQDFNVSRLQYLISDITFKKSDGTSFTLEEYHYVDLNDPSTLTFTPTNKVPKGNYSSISFTFGFDDEDNIDGNYPDLNQVNWNWLSAGMWGDLGGGYHYMRLEGKYDSLGTEKGFKTHMGTARNDNNTPNTYENNHFIASPSNSGIDVSADFSFDIEMNIEEWYENTYDWDFNVYNAPIMPIYDAQKRLNENGPTVFTIKVN